MSKPDLERVSREGPLPKVDDDSELVGEENAPSDTSGVAKEHGADFVTIPTRGAGSYPVPAPDTPLPVPDTEAEDSDAGAEQRDG